MSIPKIIWQTYKSHSIPLAAQPCVQSWKQANAGWDYSFLADSDIVEFVKSNCTDKEFEAFDSLPLGVMKADFWRYAVLYKHGGVYADIDTACRIPVEEWADGSKGLVTGVEDTRSLFVQWVIAARPRHPVLRRAIDLIVERTRLGIDTAYPEFVHYYSGPALWTDAIRGYLEVDEPLVPRDRWNFPDNEKREMSALKIFETPALWEDKDIAINPWPVFCGGAVVHMFASKRWAQLPDYVSWRKLRGALAHEHA